MFSRWQQENFFKYLEGSFAFDAPWTYDVIDGDPNRAVPNPDRAFYDRRVKELGRELTKCMAAKERAQHATRIAVLEQRIATCRELRDVLDKRATIGEVREREGHDVLELARAPKLLGDVIKMTAFHIESTLLTAMAPRQARARDEGRAVIAEFAGALAGKHPFTDAQLARLADVGAGLLQQMRPGNAPKEERTRGPEATLCDQFAALVTAPFEHLLELATLGLGRAKAEAEMPALHATARAPKAAASDATKEEATKEAAKPAESAAAPKRPSVAPPARPGGPPPN
jgi:hypothetical protein